ncbi:SdpI family protein [Peptococcaceae bacterium 1198_IL3148]
MTNGKTKISWITIILLLTFWGICASFYPSMPEQVPTHWNIKGEIDGYSHKAVATLIMPLLPLGIYLLMIIIPKIDPKKESYRKFSASYEKICLATVLIMVGVVTMSLMAGLGYKVNISLIMRILLPIFFIYLGNYMAKIKHNYTLGFKTPWTLASEVVWKKTHRLGSKLMVAGGLVALLGLLASPTVGFVIMMAGILVPTIITTIYSYVIFAQQNK